MATQNSFSLRVITPAGNSIETFVTRVTVPSKRGELDILPCHAPLVALLDVGIMSYESAEGASSGIAASLVVEGGTVEVRDDGSVVILASTVETPKGDISFIKDRLSDLRSQVDADAELSLDEKVMKLTSVYTELEERFSRPSR